MLASSRFSTHGRRDAGREKTSKVTSQLPLENFAVREGESLWGSGGPKGGRVTPRWVVWEDMGSAGKVICVAGERSKGELL